MSRPTVRHFLSTAMFCAAASAIVGYLSATALLLIVVGGISLSP